MGEDSREDGQVKTNRRDEISQNSRWLVVGGRNDRFTEVTEEKSKREEGEQQFESRPGSVSPRLLYKLVFFCSPFGLAASELLGTPGGGLLQGHARPKCGEIFRAAHVGSLKCTKSPFLLLNHPKTML